MHLSDDARTRQTHRSAKKQSLNESREAIVSNQVSVIVPDHDERLQEENQQLKEQIQEQREYHA
jgi:predicted GTPase